MIFNCKLQFLHDIVEHTAFYHCGHFWTLQCISKWGNGDFLFQVNVTYLTYSTHIVRSESDMIEESGGEVL